jgi:hypothetical protein
MTLSLIVRISGASGAVDRVILFETLRDTRVPAHPRRAAMAPESAA